MLGSHNTLTYAAPCPVWARLVSFVWRCQSNDIATQIARGARAFDIRVAWHKGRWRGAHGVVTLDISPLEVLSYINTHCKGACVRLILERGLDDGFRFRALCKTVQSFCTDLHFFGGNFKPDWRQLYRFDDPVGLAAEKTLEQHVGSMKSWWGKICPRLWAATHRNLPERAGQPDTPVLLIDFI